MVCMRRLIMIGLGLAFVGGCGSPSSPPGSPPAALTAGMGTAAAPADAAATVTASAKAVRDGKLDQAYDLLPASYQKDIDGLVHQFAGQMDSEVWEAGFGSLSKAADLLKVKKELLLSMIPKQPGKEAQTEQLAGHWDELAMGLEKFATSDLSNVTNLQTMPARDLLQKGVNPLAKAVASMAAVQSQGQAASLADLDKITAEVVTSTESTASVKITSPNKPEPETVEFAKVEGKWIPKSMADDWAKNMESARNQLKASGGDAITANKPKILQFIKTLDGVLDQMKTAENAEQLQQAAFPLVLQAMMMQGQMGGAGSKPQPPAAQVTITVGHELTEEQETKLFAVLKDLVASEETSTTSAKVDGKTIITVSPVDDVEAFAKKLTVAQEVEVDADGRTITVGKIVFDE